jgi:uncharacterized protein (TIGR02996 family)
MTRADAFLQAIIENPDDDTPRLVFADWLDENGEPERAEHIRAQCALAGLADDDPRRPALAERAGRLERTHGASWRAALPRLAGVRWEHFGRGFIEGVGVDNWKTFRAHAAGLRSLHLNWNDIGDAGACALAASPGLAGLRTLSLSHNFITDAGAQALAHSAHLGSLTCLFLTGSFIGDAGALALGRSSCLRRLANLYLRQNPVSPAAVRELRQRFGRGLDV